MIYWFTVPINPISHPDVTIASIMRDIICIVEIVVANLSHQNIQTNFLCLTWAFDLRLITVRNCNNKKFKKLLLV